MSFVGSNILAGASGQGGGGYQIERSLRFNSGDSSYLSKNISTKSTTFTLSFWLKRSKLSSWQYPWSQYDGSGYSGIGLADDNRISIYNGNHSYTTAVFRDVSAWYHLCLKVSSGSAILYVNNEQVGTSTGLFLGGGLSKIGDFYSGSHGFNGYLADFYAIDGQALAPTDFGETDDNGVWQPKEFEGAYSQAASGTTTALSQTGWLTSGGNSQSSIWDGNTSTPANGHNGGIIGTVTFNPPLTNVTKVELYTQNYHHYLNGSQITTSESSTEWHTYYDNSGSPITLNSVGNSYTNNTQTVDLMAIRINGSIIDSQNWTPPSGIGLQGTGDNSFHLPFTDNSSNAALGTDTSGNNNTWTVNNLTASSNNLEISASEVTNHNSVSNYLNVFDGDITTTTSGGDNAYITWTPATNISVSKFEAYFDNSLPNYQIVIAVAGGSTQTITIDSTEGWEEYTSLSGDTIGPNNAVTFNTIRPNGTNCGLHDLNAIRINNKIVTTNSSGPDIDSLVDTPTNGHTASDTGAGNQITGNYATFNPLDNAGTLANGNLDFSQASSAFRNVRSTFAVSSGKWYWEGTVGAIGGAAYIGLGTSAASLTANLGASNTFAYVNDGNKQSNNTAGVSYGASYTTGDVIGVAFDADNGTLTFYKNGSTQGQAYSGLTSGPYFFMVTGYGGTTWNANFGQRAFSHPVSGYKSLNTANLPEPTIADGSKYFDTKLYTGNDNTQTISGMSLRPDLLWLKSRAQATNHEIFDVVRGSNKILFPNLTNAETTDSNRVTSFNSDGFGLGPNSNANVSGGAVAWAWDAGDSNTTIAAGSIHSAATNSAQAWSSNITTTGNSGSWWPSYPATYIFDANTSNYGHPNGNGGACVVTLSFSPSITCNESVSFIGGLDTNAVGASISINGGTAVACTAGSSSTTTTTVPFSGSISSITLTKTASGGGGLLVYGFEIDGIRLTNNTAFTVPAVPSIASTVRANPSAGFSIVSFTNGDGTVGHGLSAPPGLIITKRRDASYTWSCYHSSLGKDKYIALDNSNAAGAVGGMWGSAEPTSSVFGTTFYVAPVGSDMIAYCFAPVEGYSAMGSYTGNGSADGTFVFTGFRPRWLMVKSSSNSGEHWLILDTARDSYNVADATIYANLSNAEAEASVLGIDMLSNGFKPRGTNAGTNASSYTYIYLAFAEHPFKTARAR